MSTNRGRGRGRGRGVYLKQIRSQESVPSLTIQHSSDLVKPNSHINRISISLELTTQSELWFNQFKNTWNLLKKCPAVTNMLYVHLELVENPYEEALKLMYNCLDFKYAKTKSLSFTIMEEFKIWSLTSRNKIIHLLTADVKISAFNIVRQQSQFGLMKLVADTYEMIKDCDIFLDIIKQMIQHKQYKEASQCATLLGLHNKFGINEFLIPLVLQDKLFFVEDFLNESPIHQVELVTFLDSVIGKPLSIRSLLEDYIVEYNIPEVKWEKLCYKPWRKLVTRLIKMYKLPPDVSPCLNKKRNEGALQFLLNKRFVDNSFGYESWKEMIQEAVKDDSKLQQELVVQISIFGDISEALMWAHFYNVPKEYWPHAVRLLNDNPSNDRHQQQNLKIESEDSWDSCQAVQISYHKLNLAQDHVILVDNIEEFERFLDTMQGVSLVGVDCEWKPTFGVHKSELALMQIATRDNVYILDIIKLAGKALHLWQELGIFLFNNCDILKLGFSFTSDMSIIIHSLPHLYFNQNCGFLDLLTLWKQLEKNPNIKLPYEVQSGGPSLSTLVHLCLGRPLDKSDQFSNWEKRPLRQTQLEYAALDAYCLIEVYDVLKSCSETVNFPFDDTCYSLMSTTKFKKKKSKTPTKVKCKELPKINSQPLSPHYEPTPADKICFVCDTMLQGLGKSLRRCGIDTAILQSNDDHKECVRYYQDDHRYILTRGQTFNMLMGYVPAGHCFHVQTDDIDEQLKLVLDYFNISVTKDHVFSRCQETTIEFLPITNLLPGTLNLLIKTACKACKVYHIEVRRWFRTIVIKAYKYVLQGCNSNSFVKITKSTMNALSMASRKARHIEMSHSELVDEATGFSSEDEFDDELPTAPVSYSRKWEVCTEEKLDLGLSMTRNGAKIQVDSVPTGVLEKHDIFYVCEDCGKVYWDGSHFEKVLSNRLQGIVL